MLPAPLPRHVLGPTDARLCSLPNRLPPSLSAAGRGTRARTRRPTKPLCGTEAGTFDFRRTPQAGFFGWLDTACGPYPKPAHRMAQWAGLLCRPPTMSTVALNDFEAVRARRNPRGRSHRRALELPSRLEATKTACGPLGAERVTAGRWATGPHHEDSLTGVVARGPRKRPQDKPVRQLTNGSGVDDGGGTPYPISDNPRAMDPRRCRAHPSVLSTGTGGNVRGWGSAGAQSGPLVGV